MPRNPGTPGIRTVRPSSQNQMHQLQPHSQHPPAGSPYHRIDAWRLRDYQRRRRQPLPGSERLVEGMPPSIPHTPHPLRLRGAHLTPRTSLLRDSPRRESLPTPRPDSQAISHWHSQPLQRSGCPSQCASPRARQVGAQEGGSVNCCGRNLELTSRRPLPSETPASPMPLRRSPRAQFHQYQPQRRKRQS